MVTDTLKAKRFAKVVWEEMRFAQKRPRESVTEEKECFSFAKEKQQ